MEVAGVEFDPGTDVDHHDVVTPGEPSSQGVGVDVIDAAAVAQVPGRQAVEFAVVGGSDVLQRPPQPVHVGRRQPVDHVTAGPLELDEPVVGQPPQMV